jgi:hypothetical protein
MPPVASSSGSNQVTKRLARVRSDCEAARGADYPIMVLALSPGEVVTPYASAHSARLALPGAESGSADPTGNLTRQGAPLPDRLSYAGSPDQALPERGWTDARQAADRALTANLRRRGKWSDFAPAYPDLGTMYLVDSALHGYPGHVS